MNAWKKLELPAGKDALRGMRCGDMYLLSGELYTARDKAHQRIAEMAGKGPRILIATDCLSCGRSPSSARAMSARKAASGTGNSMLVTRRL